MIKVIHNVQNNERVELPLSVQEIAEFNERKNDSKAQETAKAALLEKLGITEEEAKLLLS